MKHAILVGTGAVLGLAAALLVGSAPADAQAGPGGGAGAPGGMVVLGTGGSTQNQNDLCWILARVKPSKGPERHVLALYRAKRQGDFFDLEDVRYIDADLRLIALEGNKQKPSVADVLKSLPPDDQKELRPPNN